MTRASSGDRWALPVCSTGRKRRPVPVRPDESIRWRSRPGALTSRPSYARLEMNEQTSGCIRQVRARNRPRSSETVAAPPSRCSSTEQPDFAGWTPCRDLRELLRVAEQHQIARGGAHGDRVSQRDLAGFVDEQVVEALVHPFASEEPCGAGDERHVGRLALLVVVRVLR